MVLDISTIADSRCDTKRCVFPGLSGEEESNSCSSSVLRSFPSPPTPHNLSRSPSRKLSDVLAQSHDVNLETEDRISTSRLSTPGPRLRRDAAKVCPSSERRDRDRNIRFAVQVARDPLTRQHLATRNVPTQYAAHDVPMIGTKVQARGRFAACQVFPLFCRADRPPLRGSGGCLKLLRAQHSSL